ncbi:MAG: PQQ-binding-like beta-propeller repeat protein [Candidatus Zixiibacteriota bacterium]|nr:MAG: PQQ-binding-like beta-propeller repeat protein [candidate division Zixibacteria bacterium]
MGKASLAAVILVLVALGCSPRYRLDPERMATPSAWPYPRRDIAATGSIASEEFSGQLNLIWLQKSNDKPAGPLTIYHGALVYPGTKKKVKFYNLESGERLGILKVKGVAETGIIMSDSIAFCGLRPRRNRLYGIDLLNRRRLWQAPIKDVAPGSIIVNNRLLMSSGDGRLVAYNLDGLAEVWEFRTGHKCAAPASSGHGRVYQPDDRGVVHVLSPEDGSELYKVELSSPLMSAVAVGELVYAATIDGKVHALAPEDGEIIWQVQLAGPIWNSPAVGNDRLYAAHSGGGIVALDAATGREVWNYRIDEVVKASPTLIGRFVVAGTMTGQVVTLDADTGRLLASHRLKGAIGFPPVSDGRHVYVATESGRIACFGGHRE